MAKPGPVAVPQTGLGLPDPIPSTEAERTAEAERLIAELVDRKAFHHLTTWEVELVDELKQGKACTRVRLKELREALKRIREHAKTDRH